MVKQQYSLVLKKRVLDKLYSSSSESLSSVSKEFGIPVTTVFRWKSLVQQNQSLPPNPLPKNWNYRSKVEAVLESSKLKGEELGGWLREK